MIPYFDSFIRYEFETSGFSATAMELEDIKVGNGRSQYQQIELDE